MCAGLGAGVVVHDGVVLGRDEVTPTMPLVGPLPVCVPWAVVVTVDGQSDGWVPLVLAETGQGLGFANEVTPTTPRWGLRRCVCRGLSGVSVVESCGALFVANFGRNEATPTIRLVGPLPECVPWAVTVAAAGQSEDWVPSVVTEIRQGSGFADAVTPTTPRWGLPRCVGAQHHATRPRQRYVWWGLYPSAFGELFAAVGDPPTRWGIWRCAGVAVSVRRG